MRAFLPITSYRPRVWANHKPRRCVAHSNWLLYSRQPKHTYDKWRKQETQLILIIAVRTTSLIGSVSTIGDRNFRFWLVEYRSKGEALEFALKRGGNKGHFVSISASGVRHLLLEYVSPNVMNVYHTNEAEVMAHWVGITSVFIYLFLSLLISFFFYSWFLVVDGKHGFST